MMPAWRIFRAMWTQWRTAGMAGMRTGFDYSALRPVCEMLRIDWPLQESAFADIRLMEAEALKHFSKRRK